MPNSFFAPAASFCGSAELAEIKANGEGYEE
jgi:hypothetical protein